MIENNLQKNEINTNINLPGISKEAEGFLCKIAAPALMAGSEFLATKFRVATISTICEFANKHAEQLGIEIKPTPPKFLLPFIEKASLEDDDELKKKWAKLLVAASSEYNPFHIVYAEILSQIGRDEAKLLKQIYDYQNIYGDKGHTLYNIENNPSELDYNRLFLIETENISVTTGTFLKHLKLIEIIPSQVSIHCVLTTFGYDFVKTLEDS